MQHFLKACFFVDNSPVRSTESTRPSHNQSGHHMIRKKRPVVVDAQVVSRTEEEEDVDMDMGDGGTPPMVYVIQVSGGAM